MQICFPFSSFSGFPNLLRFSVQITTVKIGFGYGLSKLRNVGCPFEDSAYLALTTSPQTVAVSPKCCFASAAVSFFWALTGLARMKPKKKICKGRCANLVIQAPKASSVQAIPEIA